MASATSCYFLLLLLLVSATSASPSSSEAASDDNGATSVGDQLMSERFEQWMARYNRSYSAAAEKRRRFQVYMANVLYIEAANGEPGLTYELGENEFTDLTNDEFVVMYTGGYAPPEQAGAQNDEEEMLITTRVGDISDGVNYKMTEELMHDNLSAAPTSIDWRKRRAVTPVKNQGQCGSCWAFSAVASIESLHKIKKKGALKSLSEQQLVDCDTRNNGCNGGQMSRAFDWVKLNGGITTESDYPYTAKKGACKKDKLKNHAAKITGYVRVTANKEALLMDAVARQPVSVAIEAGGANFQHYRRGVYKGPCGTKLNHGVTVVGYGKDTTGTKYWIVKNSWGKSWGLNGYIWMEKDINKPQGLCGIAMQPVYPTM